MKMVEFVQDTAKGKTDSTAATSQPSSPPMRTPENVGFMESAYGVAAVLYGSYLFLMFRRWSALREQQRRQRARSNSER